MRRRARFDVGYGIRRLLKKKGMIQADLMRETGMERSYISRLASGRFNNILLGTAMALARAFGISVEEFAENCMRKVSQNKKAGSGKLAKGKVKHGALSKG